MFSFVDYVLHGVTEDTEDTSNNVEVLKEAPEDNKDDDFSIDTSLDDTESGDDAGSDTSGDTDDFSMDDTGDDSGDMPGSDESGGDIGGEEEDDTSDEAMETNASIFNSLTAEEQKIKIIELKRLYNVLYTSLDDISIRLSNIDVEEYNKNKIPRITTAVYDLKKYLSDYILMVFDQKDYYENDVMYNRFIDIVHNINDLLDKVQKEKERYEQKEVN